MKQRNKWYRQVLTFMLMVLVLSWNMSKMPYVSAAENHTLTINLNDLGTTKSNVTFKIYKVGTWNGKKGTWERVKGLNTAVSFESCTTARDWQSAAETLASDKGLASLYVGSSKTNGAGNAQFKGLADGMYLVIQAGGENTYGTITPFLMSLPYVDIDGVQQKNAVITPKAKAAESEKSEEGDQSSSNDSKTDEKEDNVETPKNDSVKEETSKEESSKKDSSTNSNKTGSQPAVRAGSSAKAGESGEGSDLETENQQQEEEIQKTEEAEESGTGNVGSGNAGSKENDSESSEGDHGSMAAAAAAVGVTAAAGGSGAIFLRKRRRHGK